MSKSQRDAVFFLLRGRRFPCCINTNKKICQGEMKNEVKSLFHKWRENKAEVVVVVKKQESPISHTNTFMGISHFRL